MADVVMFDNGFFFVSPAEAVAMDPQQRMLLERGYESLRWLVRRPEQVIAVCAHGGLFHKMLNGHPNVVADEATRSRFGNAELRACTISWADDDDSQLQLAAAPLDAPEGSAHTS